MHGGAIPGAYPPHGLIAPSGSRDAVWMDAALGLAAAVPYQLQLRHGNRSPTLLAGICGRPELGHALGTGSR